MENNNIDFNKEHCAELVKVKSIYRGEYERQGIILVFRLLEHETTVHRTLSLPRTLQSNKKTLFQHFSEILLESQLKDEVLNKPNKLAKRIEAESLGKEVKLKLAPSFNGYINIEEISRA